MTNMPIMNAGVSFQVLAVIPHTTVTKREPVALARAPKAISNAEAVAAIREYMAKDLLGAPHGWAGANQFHNGMVCAQGAVFAKFGQGVPFAEAQFHSSIIQLHDHWGREHRVNPDSIQTREARQAFLDYLDLHDPVKQMEKRALAAVAAKWAGEAVDMVNA